MMIYTQVEVINVKDPLDTRYRWQSNLFQCTRNCRSVVCSTGGMGCTESAC
jgi:hypothetical protein